VYVDDFKLAVPAHMHEMLWAVIKTKINIDTPRAADAYGEAGSNSPGQPGANQLQKATQHNL
jgi:hypothetical protein